MKSVRVVTTSFIYANMRTLVARPTPGALALASLITVMGCAGMQKQNAAPTATTTEEVVSYVVPNVKPIEAGTETQEQKQVIVSVVPRAFAVSERPSKDCVPGAEQEELLGGFIHVSNGKPTSKPYIVTTQTGVDYEPKLLSFRLKITNHSDKVMRLGELYLKININSQEVEVAKLDLDAIKAGVLLKNESKEFSVSVPNWNVKSDDTTIDFSLQNVPIAIEKNGQIAEVGDFSWTFSAKAETKETKTTKTVENLMLNAAEAASLHCHPGAATVN